MHVLVRLDADEVNSRSAEDVVRRWITAYLPKSASGREIEVPQGWSDHQVQDEPRQEASQAAGQRERWRRICGSARWRIGGGLAGVGRNCWRAFRWAATSVRIGRVCENSLASVACIIWTTWPPPLPEAEEPVPSIPSSAARRRSPRSAAGHVAFGQSPVPPTAPFPPPPACTPAVRQPPPRKRCRRANHANDRIMPGFFFVRLPCVSTAHG